MTFYYENKLMRTAKTPGIDIIFIDDQAKTAKSPDDDMEERDILSEEEKKDKLDDELARIINS